MAKTPRNYTGKDVDTMLTASTITESAIANKAFLQSKRSTWKDPFFDDLKTDIDQTILKFLGVDNAKEMRKATQIVLGIQSAASKLLAEFKVQITEDFKKDKPRRDEILKELGFTDYLKDTQKGDQEAMINLLYQFQMNMDNPLEAEITAKGTDPATITAITGYAQQLKDKNVNQEGFKSSKKEVTAEGVRAFNDIYDRVISVAKIAAKFFKDDKAKAEQFSFTKVKAALNNSSSKGKGGTPPPATP